MCILAKFSDKIEIQRAENPTVSSVQIPPHQASLKNLMSGEICTKEEAVEFSYKQPTTEQLILPRINHNILARILSTSSIDGLCIGSSSTHEPAKTDKHKASAKG